MTGLNLTIHLARSFWRVGIRHHKHLFRLRLLVGVLICLPLLGQNLDLLEHSNSVYHRSLGGAGIAVTGSIVDPLLNPASVTNINALQFTFSSTLSNHRYQLVNERKEEALTRIFKWQHSQGDLNRILFSSPLTKRMGISLGYENRINPFLYNQRRALTWSPLFNQTTDGAIGAYLGAFGLDLSSSLAAGLSLLVYRGQINSELHGENHGNDTEKWARVEHAFSGTGIKLGLQYHQARYGLGLTFEPRYSLAITSQASMSSDSLYDGLLPENNESSFHFPMTVALGGAWRVHPGVTWVVDLIWQDFQASGWEPNLYEYGGSPQSGLLTSIRTGVEFGPNEKRPALRVGYARLPQVYGSTIKTQAMGEIALVDNGNRVVRQVFSLGTSKAFALGDLTLALEFGVLTWEGDLYTYITVEDHYTERSIVLLVEWSFEPSRFRGRAGP